MFNKNLTDKIDKAIKEKFPLIYEYEFDGIVFLYGGTYRSILMNIPINDFDFVILTQGKCQIIDFIRKFKLKYYRNFGGGYKILYNGFTIDMVSYTDLLETSMYDIGLLFYDIKRHKFISFGSFSAIENRTITERNNLKVDLYSDKVRLNKLNNFISFYLGHKNKLKIKRNLFLQKCISYKKRMNLLIHKFLNWNFLKCFRFLKKEKNNFIIVIFLKTISKIINQISIILYILLFKYLLHKKYILVFTFLSLVILFKFIIKFISLTYSKKDLALRERMNFNVSKKLVNSLLRFSDSDDKIFLKTIRKDTGVIVEKFNGIKDILVNIFISFIIFLFIILIDYRIGILLGIFVLIDLKLCKKKYFTSYFRVYDKEMCTGTLGDMINYNNNINNEHNDSISKIDNMTNNLFRYIIIIIILLYGILLIKKQLINIFSLITILIYIPFVISFTNNYLILKRLSADLNLSCKRIFSLIDGNLYTKEVFGNKYKNKCIGKIEFDLVNFRYGYNNQYVLNNCSFTINHNETIAIVGRSGSGKTTILNLIARLYNVDSGSIKIDEININEYSENYIRENISVISQSPYLFDMSIKDNFRLVKEDITDKEIKKVCKLVYLDKFIESLPNKYDTIIGEGGVKLSGGQKQRLGIARALIKDTKIILLDEITSALDNETGSVIKKVIKNISKNHTIIIVTNELSIIEDNARVLLLDKGKIVSNNMNRD